MATKSKPKIYEYVRICVKNAVGQYSTISIPPKKHQHLLQLARGSSSTPAARVTAVCREAANELHAAKYSGKLSLAVHEKALRKLRGSFIQSVADSYDKAQLPDGVPSNE
jgi:hypothetical protein